jgi:methylmalonyl-CoA epimerase
MRARLSHITRVVRDLDDALSVWLRLFGILPDHIKRFETEEAQSIFLPVGKDFIKLLQPAKSENSVANFLQTYGEDIYHICLTVDDLDSEVASLMEKGVDILPTEPESAIKSICLNTTYTKGVPIELINPDIGLIQAADYATNNKGIKGIAHLGLIVREVNQAVEL